MLTVNPGFGDVDAIVTRFAAASMLTTTVPQPELIVAGEAGLVTGVVEAGAEFVGCVVDGCEVVGGDVRGGSL